MRKVKRFGRHAKVTTLLRHDDNRRDEAGAIARLLGEDSEQVAHARAVTARAMAARSPPV